VPTSAPLPPPPLWAGAPRVPTLVWGRTWLARGDVLEGRTRNSTGAAHPLIFDPSQSSWRTPHGTIQKFRGLGLPNRSSASGLASRSYVRPSRARARRPRARCLAPRRCASALLSYALCQWRKPARRPIGVAPREAAPSPCAPEGSRAARRGSRAPPSRSTFPRSARPARTRERAERGARSTAPTRRPTGDQIDSQLMTKQVKTAQLQSGCHDACMSKFPTRKASASGQAL